MKFTESEAPVSDLPEGWTEAYYGEATIEQGGREYRLVKALYEHIETSMKVAVLPPDAIPISEEPEHSIVAVEPVYRCLSSPLYVQLAWNLDPVIAECLPRGEYHESGENTSLPTVTRTPEPEFSFDIFPDSAIARLGTANQYPLDYSYVLENAELGALHELESEAAGSVPEPITVELLVEQDDETGERSFTLDRGTTDALQRGPEFKEGKYPREIPLDSVSPDDFPVGKSLATIELEFDRNSRTVDKYKVVNVEYTAAGDEIEPRLSRMEKVTTRLPSL